MNVKSTEFRAKTVKNIYKISGSNNWRYPQTKTIIARRASPPTEQYRSTPNLDRAKSEPASRIFFWNLKIGCQEGISSFAFFARILWDVQKRRKWRNDSKPNQMPVLHLSWLRALAPATTVHNTLDSNYYSNDGQAVGWGEWQNQVFLLFLGWEYVQSQSAEQLNCTVITANLQVKIIASLYLRFFTQNWCSYYRVKTFCLLTVHSWFRKSLDITRCPLFYFHFCV